MGAVSVSAGEGWGPGTRPGASGGREGVVTGVVGKGIVPWEKEPVSAGSGQVGEIAAPGWEGVIAGEKAVKALKAKECG